MESDHYKEWIGSVFDRSASSYGTGGSSYFTYFAEKLVQLAPPPPSELSFCRFLDLNLRGHINLRMWLRFFLGLFLLACVTLLGEERIAKRDSPIMLKTSVIIPCVAFHFCHLESLLQCYAMQTYAPDEVVIFLSDIKSLDNGTQRICALKNQAWPFSLVILEQRERRSAGVGRNIACAHSSGDLILTQDADDIPHPQRVEVVKYLFENYKIDHLIHRWIPEGENFKNYDTLMPSLHSFQNYDEINQAFDYVHNGNICFLSKITQTLRWEDDLTADHDVQFNREVYARFKSCAFLPWDLILYRPHLSAFHQYNYRK
jgi:hypothetical protein